MNRFWDNLILPIIEQINAKYIVEIGSDTGINTRNILEYCVKNDARMTAIDPVPQFDVEEFKAKYGDKFEIYKELSLSRLPLLEDYDVILIDGDHNWYTVYNELKIIEKKFKGKEFPLIFLHDVGWPYARRDLYYNPENIPEAYRQPYKKLGMYPGQSNLKNIGGLNNQFNNSLYENNPRNGVLTALEDFLYESNSQFSYDIISMFYGLGILYPKDSQMKTIVRNVIKNVDLLNILEIERIKLIIAYSESKNLNEQIKNQFEQLEKEKTQLKKQHQQTTKNNQNLQQQLQQLEKEKTQLKKQHQQTTKNNQNLQQQLQQLEKEKTQLKKQHQQTTKNNQNLQQQLNKEIKNLKKAENELRSAKILIEEKESSLELFKENEINNKELKVQIDRLTTKLTEIEYSTNNHRSIVQRLFSHFPSLYILLKVNKTGFKNTLINIKGYKSIKKNNLFDLGYYLKNNGDVRLFSADPLLHYIYYGAKEGRKPNTSFDPDYYLKKYEDVQNSNLNPLVHYALYGITEGRKTKDEQHKQSMIHVILDENRNIPKKRKNNVRYPLDSEYNVILNSKLFNKEWYLKKYDLNPETDPIKHYLEVGASKGFDPCPYFDSRWYLDNNPDLKKANVNPFIHFIQHGVNENRDPHPLFQVSTYLNNNPDVAKSKMNPLLHFNKFGIHEGRELYPTYEYRLKKYGNDQISHIMTVLEKKISIIIPIYNAYEDTKRCIDSVLKHTKIPYELILIDDCSNDKRIKKLLIEMEKIPHVKVVFNEKNKGFVKNINSGLKNSIGDVVLLNSDTVVTPKWLQKLVVAAYSNEKVGTVTPLSNAAGAFSIPEIGKQNKIPEFLNIDSMASLVEKTSANMYMEVPTGNGFCMFIKRVTIEDVGFFDEENFGRGYGEENDFCMRALEKGWTNIIDDSTYIYHKRSASFSNEKEALMKKHRSIINEKHPSYTNKVHEFVSSDNLKVIHNNIKSELKSMNFEKINKINKKRILYVLHQGTGGTPHTNQDLMKHIQKNFECYVLTSTTQDIYLWKYEKDTLKKVKSWNIKTKWSAKDFYNEEFRNIYFNVLVGLKIDIIHIRHLFKHTFDITKVAKKLGIPIILSFHDFYYICPSIHLLDNNNNFCEGKCTEEKQQCKIPTSLLNDMPLLKNFVDKWRKETSKVFDNCSSFVTTTEITKEIYISIFPQLAEKEFHVIEHGRDFEKIINENFELPIKRPIRILVPGNLDNHKGSEFIKKIKKLDHSNQLEFHFIGRIPPELEDYGIYHGKYERDDFSKLVKKIRPSYIGIFSICPETYCHTLSEAWNCGIPVLATKIGALKERINKNGGGWFLDHTNPQKAYTEILKISKSIDQYLLIKKEAEDVKLKSAKEMAFGYEFLYWKNLLISEFSDLSKIYKALIITNGTGGKYPPTAHIRLLLPFYHPDLYGKVIPIVITKEELQNDQFNIIEQNFDCAIIQRDCLDETMAKFFVKMCRENGIKIIYEIDDDLWSIDRSHPEYDFYLTKKNAIEYLLEKADLITVSTERLKNKINKRNIKVIKNTLDERLWLNHPKTAKSKLEKIKIGYIGSFTHEKDLIIIKEAIKRIKTKFEFLNVKVEFFVIGGMVNNEKEEWFTSINIPSNKKEYPQFVEWLKKTVDWDIGIAPLAKTKINSSKSDLKYLEYTALGLPGLYSNIGPYKKSITNNFNGILVENSSIDWEDKITKVILDKDLRNKILLNAKHDVISNSMHNQARIWYDTIKELLDYSSK